MTTRESTPTPFAVSPSEQAMFEAIDAALAAGTAPAILCLEPLREALTDDDAANRSALLAANKIDLKIAQAARSLWLNREIAARLQRHPLLAQGGALFAALAASLHADPATLQPVRHSNRHQPDTPPWGCRAQAERFFAEVIPAVLARHRCHPDHPGHALPPTNDGRPVSAPQPAPYRADDPASVVAWGNAWAVAVALDAHDWLGPARADPRLLGGPQKRFKASGPHHPLPTDDSRYGPLHLELWTPPDLHRVLDASRLAADRPRQPPAAADAAPRAGEAPDGRRLGRHNLKNLAGEKDRHGTRHYTGLVVRDLYLAVWLAVVDLLVAPLDYPPALAGTPPMNPPTTPDHHAAYASLPPALQALTPPALAPLVRQLLPPAPRGTWFARANATPGAPAVPSPSAAPPAAAPLDVRCELTPDGRPRFELTLAELTGATPPAWLSTLLLLRVGARYYRLDYEEDELPGAPGRLGLQVDPPDELRQLSPAQWRKAAESLHAASERSGLGLHWVGMMKIAGE